MAGRFVSVAAGEGMFSFVSPEGAAVAALLFTAAVTSAATFSRVRAARDSPFILTFPRRETAGGAAHFAIVQHHDESL